MRRLDWFQSQTFLLKASALHWQTELICLPLTKSNLSEEKKALQDLALLFVFASLRVQIYYPLFSSSIHTYFIASIATWKASFISLLLGIFCVLLLVAFSFFLLSLRRLHWAFAFFNAYEILNCFLQFSEYTCEK